MKSEHSGTARGQVFLAVDKGGGKKLSNANSNLTEYSCVHFSHRKIARVDAGLEAN